MQENEGSPQDKGMCPHGNFPGTCSLCMQEQHAKNTPETGAPTVPSGEKQTERQRAETAANSFLLLQTA